MTAATQVESGPTIDQDQDTGGEQKWGPEALRLARRYRNSLIPVAAIAATYGVGATAAATEMPTDLVPLGIGAIGAGGAYMYAAKHTNGVQKVYAGIAAVASEMFQLGIGVFGGSSLAAAMMFVVGSALSLPWWIKHSEPDPDVTAEQAFAVKAEQSRPVLPAAEVPTQEAPAEEEVVVTLWDKHLGASGKRLAGSQLTNVESFEYGWTGLVELQTEDHWHQILGVTKTVASVYDLPDGRVFPEATGTSVRRAKLTVIERDPLEEVRRWQGPGLNESGTFPLMTPADGGEPLRYRLWTPGGGANHGLISGGTRSGKSKVLDVALTECAMSLITRPMIIDGGGGGSLVQWLGRVEEYATNLNDAKELVKYLLNLASKRRPALIDQGGGSIEPSEEHPLVPLFIDEAHEFLMADKEFVRLCERYAQQLAKYAFGLHLSTQVPSLEQLGGSGALRGQLKTGTIVALRITEGSNQSMISVGHPLPEKLKDLPAEFSNGQPTRGLGYVMTAERKIRSRALYLENPKDFPFVDVPLEPALRAVPVPTMTAPGTEELVTPEDVDVSNKIADAIAEGIEPSDIHGLMQATGCTLGQIKQAVSKWGSGASSVDDLVAHALADGCAKNPVDIMQATGLSLGQAREVLKRF
ncbi:hypothetical protein [Saccharopolyspora taberi]|uniref:FtsK domain-containing protein n=1 Tax=Saccharopolyspora taberi TaxID=60895 RepID=A0ABN3V177_9PSEU